MVMPAGASPIDAFISCRLNEPLRKEPQIAKTFAISCPVGWKSSMRRPGIAPGGAGFLAWGDPLWRAVRLGYSITLSAVKSSFGGISRPNAVEVLRLMVCFFFLVL